MKRVFKKHTAEKDPFLLRAIEYWLDSANELGYQPLFCEWLISKGYILKYSIRNTNFEQGKDVVAVFASGEPHAFQLKGGNISLSRWRLEVKPEIEALIECPIQHPDINKSTPHVSYLVTNGEIEDAARVEIVSLNESKWKATPLNVWTRGDLLNGFQGMAEGILPKDAHTYKEIINLLFVDGTGIPDIPTIYNFFSQILNIDSPSLKKEQRRRDIAAAFLYATMIAGPYRKQKNHDSTVRILVLLLSVILYLVDKNALEDKYWVKSYELIWNDILYNAQLLESEINTNGFEAAFTSPFDSELAPYRMHSAMSVILALKAAQYINGETSWNSILDPKAAEKYRGSITLWGEAAFIPLILMALILRNVGEASLAATNLIQTAVSAILHFNGRNSKHPTGLLPPYFDIDFAVKLRFGMLEGPFEHSYKSGSYLLKPLIEILARFDAREFIADNWREISFLHLEEFVPDNSIDYYLWRIEKGENRTVVLKKEKSWSELKDEANMYEGVSLPPTLRRFPAFLPFFLTISPHRINSDAIGFLHKITTR